MNVLIIHSMQDVCSQDKPLSTPLQMQFGISYLASFLKQAGHNIRLLVLSSSFDDGKNRTLIDTIHEFDPKVILFTAISTEFPYISNLASRISERWPSIFLVAGGAHASLNPEEAIQAPFHAICIGEGEYPCLELVQQLEEGKTPSGIMNLWIKHGDRIEKNPPRPFLQDLDSIPLPEREMWNPFITGPQDAFSILLGRGCPFSCTYCSNHALKKLASGSYVRYRRTDEVIKELSSIVDRYPSLKHIYFEVETIGVRMDWALELADRLARFNASLTKPIDYGTNLRVIPNRDYDGLFKAFKNANFRYVNIGLESGSERIRRDVLKRNYSNEDIIKAVQAAKNNGLRVTFYNLLGLPLETEEDFFQTVEINRICQPHSHLTSIFYPYPGTELHKMCKELGIMPTVLDDQMERRRSVLTMPQFPKQRIQRHYNLFDYYVYKGHKPLYKILAKVLVTMITSKPTLTRAYRRISNTWVLRGLKNALKK